MFSVAKILYRELPLRMLFFLPQDRKISLERRIRGRDQFDKLSRSDGVIVSYGKSGRTWVRVLLSRFYQVKHSIPDWHLIGFENLKRRNPEIPIIFFTHDNYLKDSTGHDSDKSDYYGKQVVLLARHPADVAVSQYFQWKFRMKKRKKSLNDYPAHGREVEVFDFVMDADCGLPKIIAFMNLWANEADRLQQMLLIRYEDLRVDTAAELGRVLTFLGTPGTDEQIADAVEFASVDNMRKLEERKKSFFASDRLAPREKGNVNTYKVRRAKVGGYRDYFDDAQCAQIEALVGAQLSPYYGYQKDAAEAATA